MFSISKLINNIEFAIRVLVTVKMSELEQYLYNEKYKNKSTAVVLITDQRYFKKAEQTIIDLRTIGKWHETIVLVTIDFDLTQTFKQYYDIINVRFPEIDKSYLINKIGSPFPGGDGREFTKINQWEKFHIFDTYFKKWSRIIYFDAGHRIFDSVDYLLELDYKGCILVPNDAGNYNNPTKIFRDQISDRDENLVSELLDEFGKDILKSQYFLNCIWIYDTSILDIVTKEELINTMNKYPLCKTNEMVVMNLLFHFKYKLWKEFPKYASNKKILFDWCELNSPSKTTWRDYCFIKYPVSFDLAQT